ncbi:MAG: 4-hydroxythreonine-4-phosphate dehydrogenase PdxA [Sphingomonadaceae bacterium]|nr:4-hydroxythreonine-4-phosphate dehydrogenase PdxA [Sphingomonadaceae bacterium]
MASAPLAVTLGDPAGIGPEVVACAWQLRREHGLAPFAAIGAIESLLAVGFSRVVPIASIADAPALFDDALPLIASERLATIHPGKPTPEGARVAFGALELAVQLSRAGEAAAMVTAPVAKASLYAAGFLWPGQTEFVADRCGVAPEDCAMLLIGGGLRACPATIHIPLSSVPAVLTTGLIVRRGRVLAATLARDFGIAAPRLALTGLNPHAGEDGALGREDADVIAPAVAALREHGIDARGPFPADTLFHAEARAGYDAVLAMYHDQALIPVKTLAFDSGVNMTCGLPIIRTSPDHGTAFGIAGDARASPGAMIAALHLAAQCADRRVRG